MFKMTNKLTSLIQIEVMAILKDVKDINLTAILKAVMARITSVVIEIAVVILQKDLLIRKEGGIEVVGKD